MRVPRLTHTTIGIVLACAIALGAVGCPKSRLSGSPQIGPCETDEYIVRLKQTEQARENLQDQLDQCRAETESLKAEISKTKIELLEKAALVRQLDTQLANRQLMIDEAVVEVVRAKAKLRSIESRAEAASTMAEAEIALKSLKERDLSDSANASSQYFKAESLLKMSAREFKRENYGGALYLAGQAKARIKAIQGSLNQSSGRTLIDGEVLFRPFLPLILIKRSNLRKLPDLDSEVLRVLAEGLSVIGYSHKDDWVRIQVEDGQSGWVHQGLVRER